jgi:hypothetical protein
MTPLRSFLEWLTADPAESGIAQMKAALVPAALFAIILLIQWASA